MKNRKFNFKGYRTQFYLGVNNEKFAVTLTQDDGTWGNYLVIECQGGPYATIPVVDKEGLGRLIRALKQVHKEGFNNA